MAGRGTIRIPCGRSGHDASYKMGAIRPRFAFDCAGKQEAFSLARTDRSCPRRNIYREYPRKGNKPNATQREAFGRLRHRAAPAAGQPTCRMPSDPGILEDPSAGQTRVVGVPSGRFRRHTPERVGAVAGGDGDESGAALGDLARRTSVVEDRAGDLARHSRHWPSSLRSLGRLFRCRGRRRRAKRTDGVSATPEHGGRSPGCPKTERATPVSCFNADRKPPCCRFSLESPPCGFCTPRTNRPPESRPCWAVNVGASDASGSARPVGSSQIGGVLADGLGRCSDWLGRAMGFARAGVFWVGWPPASP